MGTYLQAREKVDVRAGALDPNVQRLALLLDDEWPQHVAVGVAQGGGAERHGPQLRQEAAQRLCALLVERTLLLECTCMMIGNY